MMVHNEAVRLQMDKNADFDETQENFIEELAKEDGLYFRHVRDPFFEYTDAVLPDAKAFIIETLMLEDPSEMFEKMFGYSVGGAADNVPEDKETLEESLDIEIYNDLEQEINNLLHEKPIQ